jgi:methylated-DNA-[protein]-cysteine S-methyltransferase
MNGLAYYNSPLGDLMITSVGDKINGVHFFNGERSQSATTPVIDQCILELEEYFLRGRKFFNVEVHFSGSDFQNKVWSDLELAIRIGDINSVRAVGLANGQNPIAIIVPCHRVIGKNGDLTGYGGGMDRKLWLLQHEGAFSEQLKLFEV